MKRYFLLLAAGVTLACSSFATTRVLSFVHQPLTTLGTEQDPDVIATRIPVLVNTVPEVSIALIGSPNKLLQDTHGNVEDSNILSLLKVKISAESVNERHYKVTIDVREMLPTDDHGVTVDQVMACTIKCLRATFDEDVNLGSYELRIQAKEGDKTNWKKYEGRYDKKKKKR
jgi:hypothetical protein